MAQLTQLGAIEEYDPAMQTAFQAFFPTSMAAIAYLAFNIFDSPCLAAISTVAKEIGNRKHFWYAIIFQNVSAYVVTLMLYQLVGLLAGQVAFSVWTIVAAILLVCVLYLLFRRDQSKKAA